MLNLDRGLLAKLRIRAEELEGLDEEKQASLIRKRYWRLAIQYHPDKGGSDSQFAELSAAYKAINTNSENKYKHSIDSYFKPQEVDFPETAFDLLTREKILERYETLLTEFNSVEENERTDFVNNHEDFINLARAIEKLQISLNAQQANYFQQQENASLLQKFRLEWLKLMISYFAEEYLDDFNYRYALATGNLYPILAFRKLFSPIKLLAAAINSLILAIRMIFNALIIEKIVQPLILDLYKQLTDLKAHRVNKKDFVFCLLKFIALIAVATLPCIFFPTATSIVFSLPLIAKCLDILACPVNTIVRPLAQYTGLSPYLIAAGLVILAGISAYLFIQFFPITALGTLVLPATIALSAYAIYGSIKFLKQIYEMNPTLGYIQMAIFAVGLILTAISYAIPAIAPSLMESFFSTLISVFFIQQGVRTLETMREEIAEKIETLPLPQEPIPESIRDTVLGDLKIGHYSHKFFNTKKEAPYLEKKDRSLRQQVSSFFGAGEQVAVEKVKTQRPPTEPIQELLLIS